MKQKLDLTKLLPSGLKNETLDSLVANLFNRFLSEERTVFVAGEVGKKDNLQSTAEIQAPDLDRELNALVPAAYVKTSTVENAYVFADLVNRLKALGCDVDRLREVLAEQWLNFAPPIDLDRFINYASYYWVGPQLKDSRAKMSWNPAAAPEYYVMKRPPATDRKKLSVDWAVEAGRTLALWGADRPGITNLDGSIAGERFTITFTSINTFTISATSDNWKLPENRTAFIIWDRNPTNQDLLGDGQIGPSVQLGGDDRYYTLGPNTENTVTVPFNPVPGSQRRFFIVEPDSVGDANSTLEPLVEFTLVSGNTPFVAGEWFEISIIHLTSSIQISAAPSINAPGANKGFIKNVSSIANRTFIDQATVANGVRPKDGDRILVWQQANPAQNGIYVFSAAKWKRASDADTSAKLAQGVEVYVRNGQTNAGKLFTLAPNPTLNLGTDPLIFVDNGLVAEDARPTNDWQEYNFWYHRDELLADNFLDIKQAVQATRPILEYLPDLQLNRYTASGLPTETPGTISGSFRKTRFNQPPLFDLFRYDGTHAKKVSATFFYVEDPDYPIDPVLLRRVKVTENADYVFGLGITDEAERLLFYKQAGQLRTVWWPGPVGPQHGPITFQGGANKGTLTVLLDPLADNQTWTVTALTPTTFEVVGTRSGTVTATAPATLSTPFTVLEELTLTVNPGLNPFVQGERFTFTVRNRAAPRYVKKLPSGQVVTYAGGPAQDRLDDGVETGVWLTPARLFQNLQRELLPELNFGDLLNHFRSIIRAQDGFSGTSFGRNNYYTLTPDVGLGGSIREFDSNFPLLLSMLIQPSMSPLGVLDFAEQQYRVASASVERFVVEELGTYLTNVEAIPITTINPADPRIQRLLAAYKARRAEDVNLRLIFGDTTALVPNWPITLPMMGLVPPEVPRVELDHELNINVIVYHDGHRLPVVQNDPAFTHALITTPRKRSDGSSTPGIFSTTVPVPPLYFPYARQLWQNTVTLEVFIFDVVSDGATPPATGNAGDFWYKRSTNQLYVWDPLTSTWVLDTITPLASLWKQLDVTAIQNSLVLAVEQLLYQSVHPARALLPLTYNVLAKASQPASADEQQQELARFSMKYGYDTYASNYVAGDAFTWNYHLAVIPGVTPGTARWHKIYLDYFDQPGLTLPTSRPDLEPWRLLNYPTKAAADLALFPATWDGLYSGLPARPWSNTMWNDIQTARPGLKLCVNPNTDQLLPPYVSPSLPESAHALLTTIPPGVQDGYQFGDEGPVELVWRKSLEYPYGAARTAFRVDPLRFLDRAWGETYVQATPGGVRLERNLVRPLPHTAFQLHGERLHFVLKRNPTEHLSYTTIAWTHTWKLELECTFVADNVTFFYVKVDGATVNLVQEGATFNVIKDAANKVLNLKIDDLGIPFSVGDTFKITFHDDIPDPLAPPPTPLALGCEGCVAPGSAAGPSTPMVQVQPTFEFFPATAKQLVGLGQLFTNLLRYNSIDTDVSGVSDAFRGWQLRLMHRFGALMRPDSLIIKTTLGQLPTTSYSILLKRAEQVNPRWISGIRVQLLDMGTRVLNANGAFIPKTDGSDWVFRLEGYNSFNPTIERYALNTAGDYETFYALNKAHSQLEWRRYTQRTALVTDVLPLTVTGIQNVLNIVYGYVDRLEELGFRVNQADLIITDEETGRNLDWQLEVEKFIDRVYSGMSAGEGHIFNPFYKALYVETNVGILSRFTEPAFLEAYAQQAAYDVIGETIPLRQLQVIRTDDRTIVYSNTPMYSARVFNDEFEHAILFNQRLSDDPASAAIFVPFLGGALQSAYLSYARQEELTRKPAFSGFVLKGNDVARNIMGSVDQVHLYYDALRSFNEPTTAKNAMALLGFSKKDYFTKLNVADVTQFNYWRGLIQAKGTNMTIDAFVNYTKFSDALTDEYWAYKLAEYGDAREKSNPEIKLNVTDVSQRYAQFQFYTQTAPAPLPLYTLIESSDDERWFSINDLGKGLKFEAKPITEVVNANALPSYPAYIRLQNIYHNGDGASPTVTPGGATVIGANLLKVTAPGTYTVSGYTWLNPTKFSPLKLIDYVNKVVIKEISLWHPAIGLHAPEPLQVINIIGSDDPALYNYALKQVNNQNYHTTKPWAQREVGRVWWDTSNLGYIPYYDAQVFPDRQERQARWGKLAEWASVDVYEWIEATVPPNEYDAKAAAEQGRSDIPVQQRASGRAARQQLYARERSVSIRPIAWSKAAVGSPVSHPSFGPAELMRVYNVGGAIYADAGRAAAINLIAGRRFGGWVLGNVVLGVPDKPVGEVIINDELVYNIGSSAQLSAPVYGVSTLLTVALVPLPTGAMGHSIGQLQLSSRSTGAGANYYARLSDAGGSFEDVELQDWEGPVGELLHLDFRDFGVRLVLTKAVAAPITAASLATELDGILQDVYVREGVRYTEVLPLPLTPFNAFINDPLDPDYATVDQEWRTWTVPSQAELSVDLVPPRNSWKPYVGDWLPTNVTSEVVALMKEPALTLRTGEKVERYRSTWSDWQLLQNVKLEKISDGATQVTFLKSEFISVPAEEIDTNRLQVFVNGVQLNPNPRFGYVVGFDVLANQPMVQVVNVVPEGASVLLIYRAPQPTAAQLAFDPAVEDDPEVQVQYRKDYQYTQLEVRDEIGNVVGKRYYFWVADKVTAGANKNMSIQQAARLLKDGPDTYALLARALVSSGKAAFDSCAIAGLRRYVTKNNAYKLRFLRDFTLRDDPEGINLKNTHTEWTLLRRNQLSRIPKQLWDKLTDAAAGVDAGGNPVPSQARIDYDEKYGTNLRFGFGQGQIFADTELVRASITNTILNTKLTIKVGNTVITDYITALDRSKSGEWFKDPTAARATMDLIWATARARQINEIFFEALEDALANNYEMTDIFKTSFITVQSSTKPESVTSGELEDDIF
jgi:hypothetical protein